MTLIGLTTSVLRDPDAVADAADSPAGLAALAPRLLGIAAGGAALFGVAVGSYHGGTQALFAALKMPALLLVPPLVVLPALHAACAAGDAPLSYRRLAAAALAGMARTGVLAAGLAPALWLPYSVGVDYFVAILLFAGALVVVGLPGLTTIARAIPAASDCRALAMAGALGLLALVTMQTGWLLRPFVVRAEAPVALLRPVEGDVFSALGATSLGAVGLDYAWDAERAGLLAREAP